MKINWDNDTFTASLEGRIDSGNSADVEKEIRDAMDGKTPASVVLDAEKLEYISSAGLRVILRLRKDHPSLRVINVASEVYEVLR